MTEAQHLKRVMLFIIAVALVFSVGGASFANFMTHRHAQAQPAVHAPVKSSRSSGNKPRCSLVCRTGYRPTDPRWRISKPLTGTASDRG